MKNSIIEFYYATKDVAGYCPPLAGDQGGGLAQVSILACLQHGCLSSLFRHSAYAVNGESTVWFRVEIDIHRKWVVETMENSSPPPLPPANGGHIECNTNKGLTVIIDSFVPGQHETDSALITVYFKMVHKEANKRYGKFRHS